MQAEPIFLHTRMFVKGLIISQKPFIFRPREEHSDKEQLKRLAKEDHIILICGHYEGVDQRVLDEIVDCEISIGDFVLTGGEIAAMAVVDAVSRLVPACLKAKILFLKNRIITVF